MWASLFMSAKHANPKSGVSLLAHIVLLSSFPYVSYNLVLFLRGNGFLSPISISSQNCTCSVSLYPLLPNSKIDKKIRQIEMICTSTLFKITQNVSFECLNFVIFHQFLSYLTTSFSFSKNSPKMDHFRHF